jgi:hypothetical protein
MSQTLHHPPTRPRSWTAAACCSLIALACVALSIAHGKDMSWDLFNYHIYAPHAASHYSLASDFMGSGWVRYLNPYAHMPFYWMVTAGWHSIIISSLLAIVHSLNLFLVWQLSRRVVFSEKDSDRDWVALSTFFAGTNIVFLGLIGSTFSDPLLSVLVLLALLQALGAGASPGGARLILAGLLVGVATGLKLTNVVFSFALAIMVILHASSWKQAIRSACWISIGWCIGFLLANGYWMLGLYREFKNPFFPLLNQYFQSPDFPLDPIRHERFTPVHWYDPILFPIKALQHASWVYYENASPDWRFAVAAILALALGGKVLCRRYIAPSRTNAEQSASIGGPAICIFFVASFCAWQATSGNARYALPLFLIIGPVCVWLASVLFKERPPLAKIVLLVVASIQGFVVMQVGNPRMGGGGDSEWTGQWITFDVPQKLREKGHAFLSLGFQSHGVIAPFVHPSSRFVNLVGMHVIDPTGPGGDRVRSIIQQHQNGSLRSLFLAHKVRLDNPAVIANKSVTRMNAQYAPWGLEIDTTDCLQLPRPIAGPALSNVGAVLLSCALKPSSGEPPEIAGKRIEIERAMNLLQSVCANQLSPPQTFAYLEGGMWTRYYVNTDVRLYYRKGRFAYSRYEFGPFDVDLGALVEIAPGYVPAACRN